MPSATSTVCIDCNRRAVLGTHYCPTHTLDNQAVTHKRLFDCWYRGQDSVAFHCQSQAVESTKVLRLS